MKKQLCFIAAIWMLLLVGCSKQYQQSQEITGVNLEDYLTEILENEIKFENIYFGSGLPTEPNAEYIPDEKGQCFVPVTDPDFPTEQALKEATEKVFTAAYAEEAFYEGAFGDYPRYREVDGKLCADIGLGGALDRQWDPSSYEVVSEDDETLVITVDYMNYDTVRTAQITFSKGDGALLIDGIDEVL